jgi:hypothetical protein
VTKQSNLPLNVDIAARAEAKLNVKAEVPSKSVGRLVDALTDTIRPFTEARGLKADILRLQREEVAIEIARLARQKILIEEGKEIVPVPAKILVPLMEKGSCEDIADNEMIDSWANLLASAAVGERRVEPRFVGILGELSGSQAATLEKIAFNSSSEVMLPYLNFADSPAQQGRFAISSSIAKIRQENLTTLSKLDQYGDALVEFLTRPGTWINFITIYVNDLSDYQFDQHNVPPNEGLDFSVLESLGLIEEVYFEELSIKGPKKVRTEVLYHHLTMLGVHFCEACCRGKIRELEALQKQKSERTKGTKPLSAE